MKIKIKVLTVVFTLLLISGSVTCIINQTVSKNIVEQEIHNSLESVAKSRANHIETLLNEYKQTVAMMATGFFLKSIVDPSKDYNQSLEQVNRRINTVISSHGDISRIRILDKKGIVVASSHTDVGQNISTAEIFLKGKEGVFIGDIHRSNFTGNIVISVAAPILVNGEFSGVLITNYDAERGLFKITTERTGLGETGEIYLVNSDGCMITPAKFVNDTFLKQKIDTETTWDLFRAIEIFEAPEHAAVIYKNYLGTEVLSDQVPIPMMGWYLVAEISEEEAFAPIAELTRRMLSIFALIFVIGVAFSIVLSRMLTKPILELHHGVEEIEKGNWDYKVGTKESDEIGQLSRAFDSMTAELKKSRAELEEYSRGLEAKVEERTKELDDKAKESEEQAMATQNLLEDVNETKNALEASQHAMLNMVHDLETEKGETESAKHALEATNIKLERSNKDLEDFVYIVSHDLKAPVRRISAFGDLLKESLEGRLDEDEQENFEFMIAGAARMQQLISDLLLYSRVSTKAKPMARVDLNEVVE